VSFTYTATGKYLNSTAGDGTTSYTYDSLDRLTSKATPEGTLSYTYDAAGHVASITSSNSNGASVSYSYDGLNRLSTVVDNRLGSTTSYSYDPASNLATATYPNGLKSTFTYDPLNRLTALNAGTASYSYQLGLTGNRTQATEGNGRTLQWSYDGIYRLTNEAVSADPSNVNGSVAYSLDPVGNRSSAVSSLGTVPSGNWTYNADDEVSTETYDNNGNTLTTGGKTLTYDAENHLTGMSVGGTTVSIVYDAFGNRVAKTVNGVTTKYLVEDDVNPTGLPQVMEEIAGSAVQRVYAYGLQRISEDQVVNNAWTVSFYGYDGAGSVRQLTNTAGTVTGTYEYDAFGNSVSTSGSTPNNYLYRGEQFDPDLGLYYLRARYYNPITGRFMSRDSEEGKPSDPKSLHKYLYADGDPVNLSDPSGRDAVETGLTFALLDTTPLPALTELAGGAYASTAAWAVGRYLAAAEAAATAEVAVADFIQAVDWATLATGLSKALLCDGLEVGLTTLLDKLAGEGASQALPSEIIDRFEKGCWEFAGKIPPLR
jgi:RHS repeat-associated protein